MKPARVEALAIGDELLDGRVVDTNTVRLAQALSEVGCHLAQRTAITDDIDDIVRTARAIIGRGTTLCVVSGGLGPTTDDLTAEAFARLAQVDLVRDAAQAEAIRLRLERRGRAVTDNQFRQADRPAGAQLIHNPVGTAPGFMIEIEGCRFVSVPGVPHEFDNMVASAVIEPLRVGSAPVARRGLYCFGIIEADADKRVAEVHTRWPQVRLQFRVKFPEIHVTLHAPEAARVALDEAFAFAQEALGKHVYATQDVGFAASVVQRLTAAKATLAVAESCTGGLITDLVSDVPGVSDTFLLGIVAYHNDAKEKLVGVRRETLAAHGAVSEATVREMAMGVRALCGATYGLGISGIAGPSGGTPDKPVGTVWMACASATDVRTHLLQLPFDRRGNKVVAAYSGLDLLRRGLD